MKHCSDMRLFFSRPPGTGERRATRRRGGREAAANPGSERHTSGLPGYAAPKVEERRRERPDRTTRRIFIPERGRISAYPFRREPAARSDRCASLDTALARQRAALILARTRAGEKPLPLPLAARANGGPTVTDLAERYLEQHV